MTTLKVRHGTMKKPRVETADKVQRALQLRMARYTYDEIAQRLGLCDRAAAYNLIHRAVDSGVDESVEMHRQLELEVLDELHRELWKALYNADGSLNFQTMDRLIAVSNARVRLLGLDRQAHTHERTYFSWQHKIN